jgi:UPF0271 protein
MHIDLNIDSGESFYTWQLGDDAAALPFVSSTNIACGGHAGDPTTMRRTIILAREAGVSIGAHPSFPDIPGFGRRVLPMSADEIASHVLAQVGALGALTRAEGVSLAHVKLHGALYHHAAATPAVAQSVAQAFAALDPQLIVVVPPVSALEHAARAVGLLVAREAFADRVYEADGTLRSRTHPDSLILDFEQNLAQVLNIVRDGFVVAHDGARVPVQAETICLHGDTPGAAERAAFLRSGLRTVGVEVVPLAALVR